MVGSLLGVVKPECWRSLGSQITPRVELPTLQDTDFRLLLWMSHCVLRNLFVLAASGTLANTDRTPTSKGLRDTVGWTIAMCQSGDHSRGLGYLKRGGIFLDFKMNRNKLDACLGAREIKVFSYDTGGLCWGGTSIKPWLRRPMDLTFISFHFKIFILIAHVIVSLYA